MWSLTSLFRTFLENRQLKLVTSVLANCDENGPFLDIKKTLGTIENPHKACFG